MPHERKEGAQKSRACHCFPKEKGCNLPNRLTLKSGWMFGEHHSEQLIQSWAANGEAGGSAGEACVAVASLAVYRAQEESSLDAVCLTLEKQECGTERYSVILLVQKHLKSLGLGLCGLSWLAVHLSQISSCHHTN